MFEASAAVSIQISDQREGIILKICEGDVTKCSVWDRAIVVVKKFETPCVVEHMESVADGAFCGKPVDFTASVLVIDGGMEGRFDFLLLDMGDRGGSHPDDFGRWQLDVMFEDVFRKNVHGADVAVEEFRSDTCEIIEKNANVLFREACCIEEDLLRGEALQEMEQTAFEGIADVSIDGGVVGGGRDVPPAEHPPAIGGADFFPWMIDLDRSSGGTSCRGESYIFQGDFVRKKVVKIIHEVFSREDGQFGEVFRGSNVLWRTTGLCVTTVIVGDVFECVLEKRKSSFPVQRLDFVRR